MSDTIYPDQSTVVHYDPNWIRAQQPAPFLHRNNSKILPSSTPSIFIAQEPQPASSFEQAH